MKPLVLFIIKNRRTLPRGRNAVLCTTTKSETPKNSITALNTDKTKSSKPVLRKKNII